MCFSMLALYFAPNSFARWKTPVSSAAEPQAQAKQGLYLLLLFCAAQSAREQSDLGQYLGEWILFASVGPRSDPIRAHL